MYVAHWMMHVNPYDAEVVAGFAQTPVEFFVRGNDSFLAGVTGAAIGAGVGLVLRLMAREMASCAEWARVDDKVQNTIYYYPICIIEINTKIAG